MREKEVVAGQVRKGIERPLTQNPKSQSHLFSFLPKSRRDGS